MIAIYWYLASARRGEVMITALKRLNRDERGQTLVLALVLLLIGGFVAGPLLAFTGNGLLNGEVYDGRTAELYAADAGVKDGLWQVENEKLCSELFGGDDPDYDRYGYYDYWSSYEWDYDLPSEVNDKDVTVSIQHVWMLMDIPAPDAYTARQIIENGKMMIVGSPALVGDALYEIKISYDPCGGIPAVKSVGIWLPAGFGYYDNCSLEDEDYYSEPTVTPYKGGCVVVWSFSPPVSLEDFPGSFTFQYEGPLGQIPSAAFSWIDTTWSGSVPGYAWDGDVRLYRIVSTATDPDTGTQTSVESYTATVELRKLGAALSGDYFAIGATLMTPTGDPYYRNRLYRESSATVEEGDLPSDAIVEAAFLYWSGWIEGGSLGTVVFEDHCSGDSNWIRGADWVVNSGKFRGHHVGGENDKYLTLKSSIDLSAYVGKTVEVSWQQSEYGTLESTDRLYFAFSTNGGSTWSGNIEAFRDDNPPASFAYTIPDQYLTANFKMRFYLYGFSNYLEYCYIDDIIITASTGSSVEDAKVNRVMFGPAGSTVQITSNDWQVASTPDAVEGSWSYSCYYDATDIVSAALDPETMSGAFTLGHVVEGSGYSLYPAGTTAYPLATPALCTSWGCTRYQWTYAGWSLLIIYSSPETKGHQLFLFDTFRYVGLDTQLSFLINNFLAPDDTTGSHLTYFVGEGDNHYSSDYIKINGYKLPRPGDLYEPYEGFNPQNNVFNSYSNSLDDPYLSGVDIDTFDVSSCIGPGDSSAEVILDNGQEIYNLVYIILSFRSLVTGGGVMGYLIK
jgi:hypothetical protein